MANLTAAYYDLLRLPSLITTYAAEKKVGGRFQHSSAQAVVGFTL